LRSEHDDRGLARSETGVGVGADRFPRITEMATSVSHEGVLGRCDDDVEFAFGLDLILDGLDRLRDGLDARTQGLDSRLSRCIIPIG
jgi:hypothetical protein